MTLPNALAFTLLGLAMFFLPAWEPEHFLRPGPDGANTSALWLECVGLVLHLCGSFCVCGEQLLRLRRMVEAIELFLPRIDAADLRWSMPPALYGDLAEDADDFALVPA